METKRSPTGGPIRTCRFHVRKKDALISGFLDYDQSKMNITRKKGRIS